MNLAQHDFHLFFTIDLVVDFTLGFSYYNYVFLFFYWLIDSLLPHGFVVKVKIFFNTSSLFSWTILLNKHILKLNFEFDTIEVWVRFSVPRRGKSQFMFYLQYLQAKW